MFQVELTPSSQISIANVVENIEFVVHLDSCYGLV